MMLYPSSKDRGPLIIAHTNETGHSQRFGTKDRNSAEKRDPCSTKYASLSRKDLIIYVPCQSAKSIPSRTDYHTGL